MQLLEQRILKDGKVKDGGILKVDSFLNHQMDISLFSEMAKEFYRLFAMENVTKILTIEASGIGIACITAQAFNCPVIFAKKTKTKNISGEVLTAPVESFTHGTTYDIIVSKEFLSPGDRVLIIDDFSCQRCCPCRSFKACAGRRGNPCGCRNSHRKGLSNARSDRGLAVVSGRYTNIFRRSWQSEG